MCTVIIGNKTDDHLLIKISGRTYPTTKDYYDGNWLSAEIHVSSGAFSGHVTKDVFLRTDEFKSFLAEIEPLSEPLKGTANYTALEDWLVMKITGDGLGHLLAEGSVIDTHCEGNKLNFSIHFDQTSLPQTIDSLRKLLDKYPVIGKPPSIFKRGP